jgi:sterol desaturase/sphingolipid hydroxylase (fatty acid hydroxylase superfamily)
MEDQKTDTNPKLIVAVQMLCIGVVLLVLGLAVTLLSPLGKMTPIYRFWSIASNGSIILAGLGFTIGGILRHRKVKSESSSS